MLRHEPVEQRQKQQRSSTPLDARVRPRRRLKNTKSDGYAQNDASRSNTHASSMTSRTRLKAQLALTGSTQSMLKCSRSRRRRRHRRAFRRLLLARALLVFPETREPRSGAAFYVASRNWKWKCGELDARGSANAMLVLRACIFDTICFVP